MTKTEKIQEILKDQRAAMQAMVNRQNALTGAIADLHKTIANGEAELREIELAAKAAEELVVPVA